MSQICINCGRSVAFGNGLFINRVPVLDDLETKKANNCNYPIGEYVCRNCENEDRE